MQQNWGYLPAPAILHESTSLVSYQQRPHVNDNTGFSGWIHETRIAGQPVKADSFFESADRNPIHESTQAAIKMQAEEDWRTAATTPTSLGLTGLFADMSVIATTAASTIVDLSTRLVKEGTGPSAETDSLPELPPKSKLDASSEVSTIAGTLTYHKDEPATYTDPMKRMIERRRSSLFWGIFNN